MSEMGGFYIALALAFCALIWTTDRDVQRKHERELAQCVTLNPDENEAPTADTGEQK